MQTKLFFSALLMLLCCGICLESCSDGDDNDNNEKVKPSEPTVRPTNDTYIYKISYYVTRNSQTGFTNFTLVAPCPLSNDYQTVSDFDLTSVGTWEQREIQENQNHYLENIMGEEALNSEDQNFYVEYSFKMSPKTISVDLSKFYGTDIPEYDVTSKDYQDNIKRSGNYVVPENKDIQTISKQLFLEANNNKLAYTKKCYEYVASNLKYKEEGFRTLSQILLDKRGDCGCMSSLYISLLRAQGIPARHVVAVKGQNSYHIWSEFYIQDFGWVPVDVTYKNGNPKGDFYGNYNDNWVVVQRGCNMDYPITGLGTRTIPILQQYNYWYYCNKGDVTLNLKQYIRSTKN